MKEKSKKLEIMLNYKSFVLRYSISDQLSFVRRVKSAALAIEAEQVQLGSHFVRAR